MESVILSDTQNKEESLNNGVQKLKLYNFNNIKAKLYFQISSEKNLLLLCRKKITLEQLSEDQQKEIYQQLSDAFDEISEKYSKETDSKSLDRAIGNKSFLAKCEAELEDVKACQELMEWSEAGVPDIDYLTPLENVGISGSSMQIKQKIAQKKAKLRVLIAKYRSEQENILARINEIVTNFQAGNISEDKILKVAEEFDRLSKRLKEISNKSETEKTSFYTDLSSIGKVLGFHIPSDILLAEWCGYLSVIRKMNKEKE